MIGEFLVSLSICSRHESINASNNIFIAQYIVLSPCVVKVESQSFLLSLRDGTSSIMASINFEFE